MHSVDYYRKQAERARKLADMSHEGAVREALERLTKDYSEIAEDLETGAIEIRHPELLPQKKGQRDNISD